MFTAVTHSLTRVDPIRSCRNSSSTTTNNFILVHVYDKMRVIEVVIDGFKSYAVRTVISGWDESFNSITGLNGSGKSNILDAICFVLGITSMSVVRASNIQVSSQIHKGKLSWEE